LHTNAFIGGRRQTPANTCRNRASSLGKISTRAITSPPLWARRSSRGPPGCQQIDLTLGFKLAKNPDYQVQGTLRITFNYGVKPGYHIRIVCLARIARKGGWRLSRQSQPSLDDFCIIRR